MNDKLNFAILGAGHIAAKMARTLDFLREEVRPYAVASRDLSRAEAIRAESRCLAAGKHVLCEKPFTLTAAEAEEVFAMARARGLFVMEAMWTRFQPAVRLIRDVIASGEIGVPRFLQATFGLAISHKERVKNPALGGGALLDLGIYPLNFAAMHFGLADISRVSSHATLSPEGVDDQSAATLEYADGRLASLTTSMTAACGAFGRISGTLGHVELPQLTRCESFTVRLVPSDKAREVKCPFDFNGYEYEVRAVAAAIRAGRLACDEMPPSETIAITRLMEQLRQEWQSRQP